MMICTDNVVLYGRFNKVEGACWPEVGLKPGDHKGTLADPRP